MVAVGRRRCAFLGVEQLPEKVSKMFWDVHDNYEPCIGTVCSVSANPKAAAKVDRHCAEEGGICKCKGAVLYGAKCASNPLTKQSAASMACSTQAFGRCLSLGLAAPSTLRWRL